MLRQVESVTDRTAESKRILSLRNPDHKMSKSAPDVNSRILLTDTPEQVHSKVKKAVTDSLTTITFDPEARPAVSNLLQILAGLDGGILRSHLTDAEQVKCQDPAFLASLLRAYGGGSGAALKKALAESIIEELRPVQTEYARLVGDSGYLDKMERLGLEKARSRASRCISDVRKHLGLSHP